LSEFFFTALFEILGSEGTIVVATSSQNIMNSNIPFDLDRTPSYERGFFSEYVRLHPDSHRSFHPFSSYAAVGKKSLQIIKDVSRQAYGPDTPEFRLINMNARILMIGPTPNIITTTHHVEHMAGVPYRYHKEFLHPVMRASTISIEPFYQYVYYLNSDIEHGKNKRIFSKIEQKLDIKEAYIASNIIYSYSIADFYRLALIEFQNNMYIWCKFDPKIRPWRV
jgi:aminoglycoside 3-N-acetyltransferase